jgi:hypothetical protein
MMKIGLFLVIVLIAACSSRKESNETDSLRVSSNPDTIQIQSRETDSVILIEDEDLDYEKAMRIESYLVSDSDPSETTTIKSKCAVYVFPDGATLEAMQKKYGDDYYTIADDANWYMSESGQTLDSLGVKEGDIKTRYVKCVVNGVAHTVDLRTPTGLYWKLFFFNPSKKPKIVSMVGLWPDTVRAYFDLPAKP